MTSEHPIEAVDARLASGARAGKILSVAMWLFALNGIVYSAFLDVSGVFNLSKVFSALLLAIGATLILYSALAQSSRTTLDARTRIVVFLLLLVGVAAGLRSLLSTPTALLQLLGLPHNAWTWMMPVAVLAGSHLGVWAAVHHTILQHTKLAIVVAILQIALISSGVMQPRVLGFHLAYAAGFLFVVGRNQLTRNSALAFAALVLWTFGGFFMARRHVMVTTLFFLIGYAWCQTYRANIRRRAFLVIRISLIATTLGLIGAFTLSSSDVPAPIRISAEQWHGHLMADSRSAILEDFVRDMDEASWAFGRGALGETRLHKSWGTRGGHIIRERDGIENGYFQVILKGGGLMLVLMLALALPAAVLGLFGARNWLVRAAGVVVAGRLIDMAVYGVPAARNDYVLFWLAVGACLSVRLRRTSDAELDEALAGTSFKS